MKKNFLFPAFVIILSVFVTSCKKGDTGPAGPVGPAGATGTTGATGVAGATGTANVIYSDWATLSFTGSSSSWSAQIIAPGVTQDIMDKGIVKTYFKFGASVYEGTYSNINSSASIYQYLNVGAINLVSTFNATYPWRYIVVPGGVSARRDLPDFSDYEAVCEFYNIQK